MESSYFSLPLWHRALRGLSQQADRGAPYYTTLIENLAQTQKPEQWRQVIEEGVSVPMLFSLTHLPYPNAFWKFLSEVLRRAPGEQLRYPRRYCPITAMVGERWTPWRASSFF